MFLLATASFLSAECVEGDDVPHGPLGAERVPPRVGVAQLSQHAFLDLVVELKGECIHFKSIISG